jgi:hypothetical protein
MRWIIAAALSLVSGAAHAVDVKVIIPETATSPAVIDVTGRFEDNDDDNKLNTATVTIKRATIYLQSNGGSARGGTLLGVTIRRRGFDTAVANREACMSACAVAWLAGRKRFLGDWAQLGFHAPTNKTTGQRSAAVDAILGRYFTSMGVSEKGAAYLLAPRPWEMNYIVNERDGEAHGIKLIRMSIPEHVPLP